MGFDGIDDVLRITSPLQNTRSHPGMILRVRILLIVEIMQKPDHPPPLLILSKFAGIGAHGRFHGQGMLDQSLPLGVLRQQIPGVLTGGIHPPLSLPSQYSWGFMVT